LLLASYLVMSMRFVKKGVMNECIKIGIPLKEEECSNSALSGCLTWKCCWFLYETLNKGLKRRIQHGISG